MFLSLLIAIPVVGILILIHEVGHFWAARWMGVRIEEFGIGFPPRALTLGERNGVAYTLNWLPFGGFVRLAGEDDPEVEGGLASAAPWRRIIVLVAGALMNLLLAFLLYTGLAMGGRSVIASDQLAIYRVAPNSPAEERGLQPGDLILSINDRPVNSFQDLSLETTLNRGHTVTLRLLNDGFVRSVDLIPRRDPPEGEGAIGIGLAYYEAPLTVNFIEEGSPADQAGLQEGDVILAVDGQPVESSPEYMYYMDQHFDQTVELTVRRDGELLEPIAVYNDSAYEGYPLGMSYIDMEYQRYGLGAALVEGGRLTLEAAKLVPSTLAALFRGSVPVSDLAGPVGITYMTAEVTRSAGLRGLLNLAALISVNLFLVNLFPIPALDGGRIAFSLVEWISGRRLPPEKEGLIHLIGFALLLAFVITVTFFDIQRIAGGGMGP